MQSWDDIEIEAERIAQARTDAANGNVISLRGDPHTNLLAFTDAGDLAGVPVQPREWMVEGWEPRGSATYETGIGASGKSLLTQQRMTCSAAGRPFLGVATRAGVSIYITCEDDMAELHRRQESINAALGISWDDLRGRLFLVSLKGQLNNEFCTFDADNRMRTTPRWAETVATIREIGATHVALDNVAHFFTGNENVRNHVAAFTGLLDRLAQDINGGVLFLGHPNKVGDEFSGSTAWENQVRARLYLSLDKAEDGSVRDPDARVLTNSKPNYSRRGEAINFRWHKWAFVTDDDLPPNTAAELSATIAATQDNTIFLACLDVRNRQERPVSESKASRTYAPKEFAEMAESKGIGRARLERAMDRLFRNEQIERGFLWRDVGEGKDRYGLRRATADGRTQPADLSADVPPTTRRPPPARTPYTTYIEGAALGAAAPSDWMRSVDDLDDDDFDPFDHPSSAGGLRP